MIYSRYMGDQFVVVLSNVKPSKRGFLIYSRYVEEPHNPQIVALTTNDNSYV